MLGEALQWTEKREYAPISMPSRKKINVFQELSFPDKCMQSKDCAYRMNTAFNYCNFMALAASNDNVLLILHLGS